ncbi:MAG TPA: ABC transporter permease [Vicinamibacterales bacterium]|jgi:predicted permease
MPLTLRRIVQILIHLLRRDRLDRDLHGELAATFELLVDEGLRAGMPVDEARRAARLQHGSIESLKDDVRDARAGAALDSVARDVRYAIRLLRKTPTFSLVAILTLALGTGANAAIFHIVNALNLRPLPVAAPDDLLSLGIDQHGKARIGRREVGRSVFSEPLWREIRSQQQAFSSVMAWGSGRWDLSNEGEVNWADGFYVSGTFFGGLGVPAHVGRLFADADDRPGCGSPGAVLSYDFWRARYGGNPAVIGQTITLDRRPFEVIGVAERGFFGVESGRTFDVALPLCAEPLLRGREAGTGRRDVWWLDVMGRLRPGWTLERARVHAALISPSVFQATVPPPYSATAARNYAAFSLVTSAARSGVSVLPPVAHAVLWILFGATGLVLLLMCANLASLMLARSTARDREIAVRLALGASRPRVVTQLLAESGLIAGLGGVSGFVIATWISRSLIVYINSGSLPVRIAVDLTPDWRLFGLSVVVATLACLLFGLGPALKATRRDPATAMQPAGRSSSDGHDAVALRRGLVVAQVAVSIVLVVGSLLFVRTLRKLDEVDLGFDPSVLAASIDLRRTAVQPAARILTFERIVERLDAVNGVREASLAMIVPLAGADWNGRILTGGALQDGDVHFNAVGQEYFRVMTIPVLQGRTFEGQDQPGTPRAALVNEAFARRYFPTADPIGKTFQTDARVETYHIVGLVRDSRFIDVGEEHALPIAYLAVAQELIPTPSSLHVIIRTDLPAASIAPALTRVMSDVAPGVAVSYDTVARHVDTLLLPQRLVAWLSSFFAILAVLIASIGLYGLISYLVSRRRVEIGVRMALGAEPPTVLRMLLGESGVLLAAGLVIGLSLATVVSRAASGLLYDVTPLDPISYGLGTAVLVSTAVLAAWIPARRASRIAPIIVLRE